MKNFWCVLFVFLVGGTFAAGEDKPSSDPNAMPLEKWNITVKDPGNPEEFMQAKWASVVNVLNDKELEVNAKAAVIDRMITPIFDFELMGKLALGKTNWSKFTDVQREKFLELFVGRLKTSYREKFMLYENQKAEFEPAVQNNQMVQIPMSLISKDKKTAMLYKLRKTEKSWKIYDVEIEGVSILLTYRSQFNDILSRGTVDELLRQLAQPADSKTESAQP